MRAKWLRLLIISALLSGLLLSGTVCALSEEILMHDHAQLYIEGSFPEMPAELPSAATAEFEAYIIGKLSALAKEINVSSYKMTREEFRAAYQGLLNRNPELFYVNGGYSYYQSNGIITSILPDYRFTGSTLTKRIEMFNTAVDEVVRYAQQASTPEGILLRANDYLCANYQYDLDYSIYTPDEFFESGEGVCQAYTMAFGAVLHRLGFSYVPAQSDAMNHIWNVVNVEGGWYHIDVTWNDPISDMPYRACHDNFMLSDAGIQNAGHYDWISSETADNTRYDDYFWKNLNQPAPMDGDFVYYVEEDSYYECDVRRFDLSTEKSIPLFHYDYGYDIHYIGYNPIWVCGENLYYAVCNKVYCVPLSGGNAAQIFSVGDSSMYIWSMFLQGDKLFLYASPGYGEDGQISQITLDIDLSLRLSHTLHELTAGGRLQLTALLSPDIVDHPSFTWSSSNAAVAAVNADGLVTAVCPGVAVVTARYTQDVSASCILIIHDQNPLRLPQGISAIEEEAFRGISAREIILPDGIKTIGSRAFSGCGEVLLIVLPDSLTSIAKDAFEGASNAKLICNPNTAAEAFARQSGLDYMILE